MHQLGKKKKKRLNFNHLSTKSNLHCLHATVKRTTPQPFFNLLCSRVFLSVFLCHKTQEMRPVLPTYQSAGKRLGGGWEPRRIILSEESKYEPSPSHIVIPTDPIQYYSPAAPMDITIDGRHFLH